ncbi:MAG: cytochrome c4 [Gammaproteobacteria bacterium]|nr:MAG: cytochrome c4 [Gammaproteobacteria bacterium]
MSNISYAGDAKAGAVKAATCVACHGADGNSMAPNFPNLAGQGEPYIIKQLTDLKANKTRKDATMIGMVAALTPIDMENIAAFFSAQKLKIKPIPMSDAIKKGQDIYRGGITGVNIPACIGCHGPKGEGNPGAKYPALSGQNQVYSLKQLKDFQSGARFNDEKSVMRDVVKRMTVDEMQAVTSYIAGLK